jgi:hypothetical protein
MADVKPGSSYPGRQVKSPNNTGPTPPRPHPNRDNAQDPRRPYTDGGKLPKSRQDKGFVNTMMGGGGGMDDSQRRADTREFAKHEVSRHLRDHQSGWKR